MTTSLSVSLSVLTGSLAAVLYECIRTITSIYVSTPLLEQAASCISRFIAGESHNLKYIGIRSLTAIVGINAKYVWRRAEEEKRVKGNQRWGDAVRC
jgi:hypothetical protein